MQRERESVKMFVVVVNHNDDDDDDDDDDDHKIEFLGKERRKERGKQSTHSKKD